MRRSLSLGVISGFLFSACTESEPQMVAPPVQNDGGTIMFADSGANQPAQDDAGVPEADAGVVPEICRNLGLTPQPFRAADSTYEFGAVAGDFTVSQYYAPDWSLKDNWTGCESYVFVNYIPVQGTSDDALWSSRSEILVDETPVNTHFFFVSWESTPEARLDRIQTIYGYIVSHIELKYTDTVERERQLARFHFVTDAPSDIRGSVNSFLADYMNYRQTPESQVDLGNRGIASPPLPVTFGIDRDQEWDSGGNMNEYVNGPPSFRMASYLGAFYNHKAKIRDQVATETGVDTHVLLDDRVTSRIFVRTATLPSANEMANFDTLEFDVTVNCPHRNVFGCSEWDRVARIEVCTSTTVESPCSKRREIVRWITPYWRRGERRWIMDASTLMGYVKDGGLQYFRIEMGPGWERATARDARVALRLSNGQKGLRSVGVERAFTGGGFNANYNDRAPFKFTPPASATKVELVSILSGHGQDGNTNCAEWCDHRHQFVVNNQNLDEIRHEGQIGSTGGCGWAAAFGASPGQWGNWAPERAYWCPGLPVDHKRIDITAQVSLGQENTITYSANYRGGEPGGGNISLSTYVVWYE